MSRSEPVPNAQAQAFLESLPRRSVVDLDVADARRNSRERSVAASGVQESVAEVAHILAGTVPARLYLPVGDERAALVWLHGGGWALGDLDGYDALARALANRARCAVLSVDYRLAPEHPFPAAVDECWIATKWTTARFEKVAVGGDSAGGNLAAVVARRARDCGLELAFQLLVYPMLDYGLVDGETYREWDELYRGFARWDRYRTNFIEGNRRIWEQYVPDPADRLKPDASPMRAASFERLAPALVITAEHDLLCREGEDYARVLNAAGVSATVLTYVGQIHGFFHMLGLFDDAHDAVEKAAAALRAAFAAASLGQ